MRQIGKVTHYYGKIGVATVTLDDHLDVGDRIKIQHGNQEEVDEYVNSMQIEHLNVQHASREDEVGIKIHHKVHEGDPVYILE